MICTLDVAVQAANPTMPLMTWKSFRGSPTSVRVRNVPKKIGAWEISKVRVIVNYPDNSSRSVEAVLTGGVWVATIAACEVVGESANGYVIEADGKDERGEIVAGYVLGTGDVKIYDIDATITPGEATFYVHLVDTKPETPNKGDFALDTMEIYDGETWRSFSAPADYAAVRAAAAKGAAHADKGGNPHGTTFASLPDKPTIPDAVTEATVSGWGFLKATIESIKTALLTVFAAITHSHVKDDITDFPAIPAVVAPASDMAFSSEENKDKVPTCGSVGAALLRRVATAEWSKITAQDIADFLNYKGEVEFGATYKKGDVIDDFSDRFRRCNTDCVVEEMDDVSSYFDIIYDKDSGKTGLEKLIKLFGSDNEYLKAALFADTAFSESVKETAPDGSLAKEIYNLKQGGEVPDYTLAWNPDLGQPGYYTKD